MINTMYGLDTLGASPAFLAALLIGIAFGFFLEQAGFGSSRKLTGVFYFTDMAVIKVMFSAVITAALGLATCVALGWVSIDSIYLMPTVYGAYIVGGLIFGVGFVMGGWCPGTAAAGIAGGKLDALVFMAGATLGSVLFNELFAIIKPLYEAGNQGVLFVYDSLGLSKTTFLMILGLAAVLMFWGCEWIENRTMEKKRPANHIVLKVFSVAILILAVSLSATSASPSARQPDGGISPLSETQLLAAVEQAQDHIAAEELADRMLSGEQGLIVVDIRPAEEYLQYHLPGALNVPMSEIHQTLLPYKNTGAIVLYSNGMTHPVQARDSLARSGFNNAYILTDGLNGLIERCLTPASLRPEPVTGEMAHKIKAWRNFFLGSGPARQSAAKVATSAAATLPEPLVDAAWLEQQLGRADLKIIDLRPQPEYNTSHIPGSLALNIENLRTNLNGVGSMLQPAEMLAIQLSSMGFRPADAVIIVYGDKTNDASLVAIALERVGHRNYAILNGGFASWKAGQKPLTTELPAVEPSHYLAAKTDSFTVNYQTVLDYVTNKKGVIMDVRPVDYYSGAKSEEARAGHIPGAINRPYTDDLVKVNDIPQFKPVAELEAAYKAVLPAKDAAIIIHCRTGHQASQTYFVLNRLLGYKNVLWYDAGWSEWAARQELPVEK